MKEKEMKKNYCAPLVEVMNARVERGFQMSIINNDPRNLTDDSNVNGAGWIMENDIWFT